MILWFDSKSPDFPNCNFYHREREKSFIPNDHAYKRCNLCTIVVTNTALLHVSHTKETCDISDESPISDASGDAERSSESNV